jgi:uncharacterized protein
VRVAVTGASGLIGTALVARLRAGGHDVVRLVRRSAAAPDEVSWDPAAGTVDAAGLAGVEGAVHLAGAGVGDHRWTAAYKQQILDSRVQGTATLVAALVRLDPQPQVLVSGSAQGFYGDRGEQTLTEDSPGGTGFLSDVVREWEAATEPAVAAGIRVVKLRSGLVMAPGGGAFGRLLPLARLGLAGPLGSGRQWWSWITLTDEVAAIEHLLTASTLAGPVNCCAPNPGRNADVVRAVAAAMHRPALLPAPAFALRAVLGEFSQEVLASTRMLPQRLLDDGFPFTHPGLGEAAAWLAGA